MTPPGFRDSAFDRADETSASDAATYAATDADEIPADPPADAAVVEPPTADEGRRSRSRPRPRAPRSRHRRARRPARARRAPSRRSTPAAEPTPRTSPERLASTRSPTADVTGRRHRRRGHRRRPRRPTHRHRRGRHPVAAATGVRTDVGGRRRPTTPRSPRARRRRGRRPAAPTDDAAGRQRASGSQAAGTAPIDGYDSFSIAQLRGRLRGYALARCRTSSPTRRPPGPARRT